MRSVRSVVNVALVLTLVASISPTVRAEERALNLESGTIWQSSGVLAIVVGPLPKGLFTSKNMLDKEKSKITVTQDIVESDCHPEAFSGVVSSDVDGTFIPLLNPQGKVDGYKWLVTIDLSGQQNHWNNHTHCDGSIHVHGCATSRTVALVATLNNPGDAEWGTESINVELEAVQDPDEVEDCPTECDTDSCEEACDDACDAARTACRAACPPSGMERGPCISGCNHVADTCHGGCACDCKASTAGCTACE